MTKTTMVMGLLILALAALAVRPAFTEEEAGPSPMEVQEWYMKIGQTGDHHDWMNFMAGKWTTAGKYWMAPEAPPTPFEGRAENDWILAKHFVRSKYAGQIMGMPYEGEGTLGYNNATEKFQNIWIDNMSTAVGSARRARHDQEGERGRVRLLELHDEARAEGSEGDGDRLHAREVARTVYRAIARILDAASPMSAATVSTSASVVKRPRPKRTLVSAARLSSPIAART